MRSVPSPSHRRRQVAAAVAAALLAASAAAGAAASPVLDVDRIEVAGTERTPASEVVRAAGVVRGDALVTVDAAGAAGAVEALPWVERAAVRRRWPGTLVVEVVEREPLAALAVARDRWVLVDGSGRRLARVRRPEPGLVAVRGLERPARGPLAEPVDRSGQGALELVDLLPSAVRFRQPRVAVQRGGDLVCKVRTVGEAHAVARLGRPERLREKVTALATILESSDLRGVSSIDLRVPIAPVLTRT